MKIRILIIFFLLASTNVKADMACVYTSYKAGITLKYVAECDFKNQATLDSILNLIVEQIKGLDTNSKVLVLVDFMRLSFSNEPSPWFASIAFDTLREIDNNFIFDYYWNKEQHGCIPCDTRHNPISINSTNKTDPEKTIGLKIIYDNYDHSGFPIWADLVKMVVYSVKYPGIIKREQNDDTVRFNTNGWYVSLLTIDTIFINKILGKQEIQETEKLASTKEVSSLWLLILLCFVSSLLITASVKKHSS
ncbi:MAG: hypothetical protein QM737_21865 [Ferruginibacter sp.]